MRWLYIQLVVYTGIQCVYYLVISKIMLAQGFKGAMEGVYL